jgi:hypothetical protein
LRFSGNNSRWFTTGAAVPGRMSPMVPHPKRWLTLALMAVTAVAGGCSDSDDDDAALRTGAELTDAADHIQAAVGSAAVVSTVDDLGAVTVVTQDADATADAVMVDACEAALDLDGAPFSIVVIHGPTGRAAWEASTDDLERCPPR